MSTFSRASRYKCTYVKKQTRQKRTIREEKWQMAPIMSTEPSYKHIQLQIKPGVDGIKPWLICDQVHLFNKTKDSTIASKSEHHFGMRRSIYVCKALVQSFRYIYRTSHESRVEERYENQKIRCKQSIAKSENAIMSLYKPTHVRTLIADRPFWKKIISLFSNHYVYVGCTKLVYIVLLKII